MRKMSFSKIGDIMVNSVSDYNKFFFKLVDARCKLHGLVTTIEGYLKAKDNDQELMKEIYFELLKKDIFESKEMLEKGIHDEECETE
jgi:hypothetical protein